jgi:zinc D-Ala-D-Ala dipeptidase
MMRRWLFLMGLCVALVDGRAADLPPGFAVITNRVPTAEVALAYYGTNNFVGARVDGYRADRGMISIAAARALQQVSEALAPFGYHLYIFDAYRPQRAVDHFVRWAADLEDTKTKAAFYPDIDKDRLIPELYIADQSSHSRGSTVDLTIAYRDESGTTQWLDMGSPFDYFGTRSWPDSREVTPQQRANRLLLRTLMVEAGFVPYDQEWWHFTLADEPFPATWFDFPIE